MRTLLFLFLTVGLVASAPLFYGGRSVSTSTADIKRQRTRHCVIEGNSDFYGLGIRIGIYLQWITALGANLFSKEAIDGNLETNTIFLLAVFIAIAVATAQDTVQSAELVILLQLGFGFLFSILSIWGHRTRSRDEAELIRFPLLGSFFRLTLTTALSAYGLWFWFVGLPIHHQHDGCADFTFMFARLDIAGGIRIFFQIQTVLVFVVYGVLFARELTMIFCFFVFVVGWTSIIAAVTVFGADSIIAAKKAEKRDKLIAKGELSPKQARKRKKKSMFNGLGSQFALLLRQWVRISTAVAWKQMNGKESAGGHRPDLDFYLVPFLDFWIFTWRTAFQLTCLLFFDWCPPIAVPPLIPHPIFSRSKQTLWNSFKGRMNEWYDSEYTHNAIHASNIACIAFAVIAVELTLVWNNVQGVYTIDSVGQLIPFIISIVGFVRLLHEISVERSAISSTEVIMEMLDIEQPDFVETDTPSISGSNNSSSSSSNSNISISRSRSRSRRRRRSKSRSLRSKSRRSEETFSLHDGNEAVFWNRCPKRRYSLDVIRVEDIFRDEQDFGRKRENDRKAPWEQHLRLRFDRRNLRRFYGPDGIEEYENRDGKRFIIVKNFRRLPPPSLSSSSRSLVRSDNTITTEIPRGRPRRRRGAELRCTLESEGEQSQSRYLSRPASEICNANSEPRSRSAPGNEAFRSPTRGAGGYERRAGYDDRDPDSSETGDSGTRRRQLQRSPSPGNASRRSRSRNRSRNRSRVRRRGRGRDRSMSRSGSGSRSTSTSHEAASEDSGDSASRKPKGSHGWLTKGLLLCFCLCLQCFIGPIVKLLALIWKWKGDRILEAGKKLAKNIYAHIKESWDTTDDKKSKTAGPPPPDAPWNSKPKPFLPHCRQKSWWKDVDVDGLAEAFSSRSISKMVPVLARIGEDLFLEVHMPESAEMMKNFTIMIEAAKEIRQRKKNNKIGKMDQHKLTAEKWQSLFGEGFWGTISNEFNKRPKKREWKKWEVDAAQGQLERWYSWTVGDDYGGIAGQRRRRNGMIASDGAATDI